jgi:hypothetical protein
VRPNRNLIRPNRVVVRVPERSAPEVDERQPGPAERLVEFGDVVDVVAEDALDRPAARVRALLAAVACRYWTRTTVLAFDQ